MTTAHDPAGETLRDLEQRFARCETTQGYEAIRADALRWAATASDVERFRALLVAADCRYWALRTEGMQRLGERLAPLVEELAGLADPFEAAQPGLSRDVVEQWSSLLDVTARTTLEPTHRDAAKAGAWQRLARHVESLPPELVFSASLWGTDWRRRSILAAGGLGAISMVHGDGGRGAQRFLFALELSLAAGDPLDDRLACEDLHGWLVQCWRMHPAIVVEVARIDAAILDHADQWRRRYRSRAGRLWIAQLFDGLLHALQRDMAEPILPGVAPDDLPKLEPLFDLLRERLFRAVEAGRSRLLLDRLNWGAQPFADAEAAAEAGERERALLALRPASTAGDAGLRREMQLVSRLPMLFWQHPRQDVAAYRARLASVDALEALFARHDAGLDEIEPVVRLEDVMDSLREGEALIEYAIPRDTLHPAPSILILGITRERIRHVVVPLEGLKEIPGLHRGDIGGLAVGGAEPLEVSPLGELVFQARLAIQQADTERAMIWLRLLHLLLIAPLEKIGLRPQAFDCWHLVPHGVLHSVPFRALVGPDGGFLAGQVALSTAPSASVWSGLRRPWPPDPGRFTGFAHPTLDPARWSPLPHAEKEVRAAAERIGEPEAELYVREAATLEAFARRAPGSGIVHLATHGDFPEADVIDLHRVMLTPGPGDTGGLTAERIRETNLHGTGLVVLSVCDGGLYRVGPADELYGLVPAVLEAGASNVLTTLWSIDDAMARLWMREFYKPLAARGPAQAAKAACEAFIADGALLRDWAGFVVVGAAEPAPAPAA